MGRHILIALSWHSEGELLELLVCAHPLCKLLEKECKFYFDESCLKEFRELKEKLVFRASIISPDWCDPFELMCDAIGVALGVVLGHIRDKILHPIYYASKSLIKAQKNCILT